MAHDHEHAPKGSGWGDLPLPRLRYDLKQRAERFPYLKALAERVLVFDGAMGTELQKYDLGPEDYGGARYEGCPEILNVTRPDVIREIHARYLEAGADVIETNTFGVMPHVIGEYGLAGRARELAEAGARLAREQADAYATAGKPRFVAGSLGPGTKLISLGQIDWDELYQSYRTAARGLIAGGVDLIIIETAQDILQVRCAVQAVQQAMRDEGREVPLQTQVTIETTGQMLVGSDAEAALAALESLPVDVVGMNCATGPDLMDPHIRVFAERSSRPTVCMPNAGLPRNEGGRVVYDLTPEELVRWQLKFVSEYGLNVVGGCCGTGPEHIRALSRALGGRPQNPRRPARLEPPAVASLYQAVELRPDAGVLMIGERTNATGSRKFRELLFAGDLDGIVELAQDQVAGGAQMLDVSVAWTGRDERADMVRVVRRLAREVDAAIMIDSTQPEVIEAALEYVPGRPVVNSVNFEDGEARFDRIAELARAHGAAVVALAIDEEGMAKTVERKLEVARRIYRRLVEKHGFLPEDILFDLLTFPITQGDEDTRRLALATLEAMRYLKDALPGVGFVLGVSNVSFGLKPAARKVLNAVFLHEAQQAGLTAAIVHPGKIVPVNQIPAEAVRLARDLIYDRREEGYDPLFAFMDYFESHALEETQEKEASQPVELRLRRRIVAGRKKGLEDDLAEALNERRAEEIINEILLPAMQEVGDLFGSGQMQLPFVLKSAEVMKAAVAWLEPHLERQEGTHKGTLVLATVKGDVHDIGKNLVDIILSNNGYRVINLGIKQPIDSILEAVERYQPDAVGMSGLLVKSTTVMKENLEHMAALGHRIPVILGGAALNRTYVERELRAVYPGTVHYAPDAFAGLKLMEEIVGSRGQAKPSQPATTAKPKPQTAPARTRPVGPPPRIPRPPFFGRRVVEPGELDLFTIARYLNENALFRGQWGYKRGRQDPAGYRELLEREARPRLRRWLERAAREGLLEPRVVYGFWPAAREGDGVVVFDPASGDVLERFHFPRQRGGGLSLADYFRPRGAEPLGDEDGWLPEAAWEAGARDVLALMAVTMGPRASDFAKELFEAGE
ncbi:methionine synthase [Oceanithermus sp.]